MDDVTGGDIYIGGGETDAVKLIAKIAKELHDAYPDIHFHLYSGNAEDVTERLDKGLLDFGLLIQPADLSKYDFLNLPATDVWGVVMRKDSPLARKKEIPKEDLLQVPLICSRQALVRKQSGNEFTDWFGEANTSEHSNLCFRPLTPRVESGLNIIWKKYQVFSPAAELFLSRLQEAFSTDAQAPAR